MKIKKHIENYLEKNIYLKKMLKPFYVLLGFKKIQSNINSRPLKKYGVHTLLLAKKALDSINVTFWPDFGTLLGLYRNNGFIKGDCDIDISIFLKDYSTHIDVALCKYGFKKISEIKIIDNSKIYGLEQTYDYNGLHLDIFYHIEDDDFTFTHSFMPMPNCNTYEQSLVKMGGVMPIEQYFPNNGLTTVSFLEQTFNIPNKVDEYLSYHYGDDYMIPRKWDFTNLDQDNRNAKVLSNKIGTCELYK